MFHFCSKLLKVLLLPCVVLASTVTSLAQVIPQPLPDAEFQKVLQSSDTLDWMKIVALTDEQAKVLAKYDLLSYRISKDVLPSPVLWLKALRIITDAQARSLKQFSGSLLLLDGLQSLSEGQMKSLSEFEGTRVFGDLSKIGTEKGHDVWYIKADRIGVLSLGWPRFPKR